MFCTRTPQKRQTNNLTNEDSLLKQLSPFPQCLTFSSRKKNPRIQLIQSPIILNKDLFSQLLVSQVEAELDVAYESEMMEQELYDEMDHVDQTCSKENDQEEVQCQHDMEDESSDNDTRKRKRKSAAQIKMLKKELDMEANWSKDKIAEMSQVTGLSQSQVYKWWWDQKKKNQKGEKAIMTTHNIKIKLIRKKLSKKNTRQNVEMSDEQFYEIQESAVATKLKANVDFDQLPQTERKINKRLVFV